jgi:hypothetical protein
MPKSAEHRFWEAIDAVLAKMEDADERLMALFTGGR